jgi:hypothetical protein
VLSNIGIFKELGNNMAFEQNTALQSLMNAQPSQAPRLTSQPLQDQNQGGFWNSVLKYLFGTDPQMFSYSPYTQPQQQYLNNLLSSGAYNQANPYQGFEQLQNQITNQFHENIVPQLAERFTSMGQNALSSPDFTKQIRGGGQGLANLLLQHKINYGQQNREFGFQQGQAGLRPQFETAYTPGQQGLIPGITNRALPALGSLVGLNRYGGQ